MTTSDGQSRGFRDTRRWFCFSLRTLLIAITAFAVWLGVSTTRHRRTLRELARMVASYELQMRHLEFVIYDASKRDQLSAVSGDASNYRWSAEFRLPSKLDPSEHQVKALIDSGHDEAFYEEKGATRYLKAVRAQASCLKCHRTPLVPPTVKANEIMVIVQVDISYEE